MSRQNNNARPYSETDAKTRGEYYSPSNYTLSKKDKERIAIELGIGRQNIDAEDGEWAEVAETAKWHYELERKAGSSHRKAIRNIESVVNRVHPWR
ncbi:hypothetical protein BZZ01_13570 [Nostocales cyanobacterium HT-58-2]|nr:hypothetical protein BZZ01_13570 [Nostocales cyanobacterium HT-58-2]